MIKVVLGDIITDKIYLSCRDKIFQGVGLFETMQVIAGRIIDIEQHWARIAKGAKYLQIDFALSYESWQKLLVNELAKNPDANAIKFILTAGEASRGLASSSANPEYIIQAFSYNKRTTPLKIKRAFWNRDKNNPIYKYKSVNYLEAVLAMREAKADGFDDAYFLNQDGNITETTIANIFVLKNNRLYTPPITDGVLPGITREKIITIADNLGIPCYRESIKEELLYEADAVFTCNSLQGIILVEKINSVSTSVTRVNNKLINALMGSGAPR